jgi:hypothetical protein
MPLLRLLKFFEAIPSVRYLRQSRELGIASRPGDSLRKGVAFPHEGGKPRFLITQLPPCQRQALHPRNDLCEFHVLIRFR